MCHRDKLRKLATKVLYKRCSDNNKTTVVGSYVSSLNRKSREDSIETSQLWAADRALWLASSTAVGHKGVRVRALMGAMDGCGGLTNGQGKSFHWFSRACLACRLQLAVHRMA